MNVKFLFYGCLALGLFSKVGGLGDVAHNRSVVGNLDSERQEMQRYARAREKDSRAALQMAKTCKPVVDYETQQEYVLTEGTKIVERNDPTKVVWYTGYVCNSSGDVAEVVNGEYIKVLQVAESDMEEFRNIFSTRQNAKFEANREG